jgi:hypothetical protein
MYPLQGNHLHCTRCWLWVHIYEYSMNMVYEQKAWICLWTCCWQRKGCLTHLIMVCRLFAELASKGLHWEHLHTVIGSEAPILVYRTGLGVLSRHFFRLFPSSTGQKAHLLVPLLVRSVSLVRDVGEHSWEVNQQRRKLPKLSMLWNKPPPSPPPPTSNTM